MSTTAAGRIGFGGGGFGPEYITARRKRRVQARDHESQGSGAQGGRRGRSPEEMEVFLFTVKDPIRSALVQLMHVIQFSLTENPVVQDESPEIISGPLGYTSLRAVRPVAYEPTKTVFKPVLR